VSLSLETAGLEVVWGRRQVLEVLRAGRRRVKCVCMQSAGKGSTFGQIKEQARQHHAEIRILSSGELASLSGGEKHQGIVAFVEAARAPGFDSLLLRVRQTTAPAFLLALDELKDPQNVGAIIRTAEAAGALGVVMTLHRSSPVRGGVERASAGAVEYLPVVQVVNLREALERLKKAGCWVIGADASGEREYTEVDLTRPAVLVFGEEGRGLRSLTRRTCDELVRIPMRGRVESLNVSASAAVLSFELVRQRRVGART